MIGRTLPSSTSTKLDAEGKDHTFGDYEVGKYIDLFDQEDDDYALFEITEAPTKTRQHLHDWGFSNPAQRRSWRYCQGSKSLKWLAADPTDYVRKTGDTMTGSLNCLMLQIKLVFTMKLQSVYQATDSIFIGPQMLRR